jgi:hypothetical protein
MAKKRSYRFDHFIEVVDKNLLSEYLKAKISSFDSTKEITPDYVYELLDAMPDENDALEIEDEVLCINDMADTFMPQIKECILNVPGCKIEWSENDPQETVVLRIYLRDEESYQLVYDLFLCEKYWEKLHHYPLESSGMHFAEKNIDAFKEEIGRYFKEQRQTENCFIREREYKGRHYILVLRCDNQKTLKVLENGRVRPKIYRPAKEDMVVYDKEHSVISMTSSISSKDEKLSYVNAFNKHFLNGKKEIGSEFFSKDNHLIDLKPLLDKKFYERTDGIRSIRLAYIFVMKQGRSPIGVTIKSDNVLESLEDLEFEVLPEQVISAKVEFYIGERKRSVSVSLTRRGTAQIKQRKEREIVEQFLRDRKILSF